MVRTLNGIPYNESLLLTRRCDLSSLESDIIFENILVLSLRRT
jgi:hypothetical protein